MMYMHCQIDYLKLYKKCVIMKYNHRSDWCMVSH